MSNNGILKYLKSFYKYVDSFNSAQAGFVNLAEGYSGLLSTANDEKMKTMKIKQTTINAQIDTVKGHTDVTSTDRKNAEEELARLKSDLKQTELEYEKQIESLTPITSAVQQMVKTLASGASILPQIGESVLTTLSKAVELASSVRV